MASCPKLRSEKDVYELLTESAGELGLHHSVECKPAPDANGHSRMKCRLVVRLPQLYVDQQEHHLSHEFDLREYMAMAEQDLFDIAVGLTEGLTAVVQALEQNLSYEITLH